MDILKVKLFLFLPIFIINIRSKVLKDAFISLKKILV